jgi:hypothetical protein
MMVAVMEIIQRRGMVPVAFFRHSQGEWTTET